MNRNESNSSDTLMVGDFDSRYELLDQLFAEMGQGEALQSASKQPTPTTHRSISHTRPEAPNGPGADVWTRVSPKYHSTATRPFEIHVQIRVDGVTQPLLVFPN